jgi:3-hydroxybutyryl-CoA dehydratase
MAYGDTMIDTSVTYFFEDMRVGMTGSFAKTISEADVETFAGVTGDFNPIHVNRDYAEKTIFKHRIAHGLLSAGLISSALGNRLPGPGAIYMSQTLNFIAPVAFEETVTATVTVKELRPEHHHVVMTTVCTVGDKIVIFGEALLKVPSRASTMNSSSTTPALASA